MGDTLAEVERGISDAITRNVPDLVSMVLQGVQSHPAVAAAIAASPAPAAIAASPAIDPVTGEPLDVPVSSAAPTLGTLTTDVNAVEQALTGSISTGSIATRIGAAEKLVFGFVKEEGESLAKRVAAIVETLKL